MKWNFKDYHKETDHHFLNLYTVHYEVEDNGIKKPLTYFVASRNENPQDLRIISQDFQRSDAVLVGTYTYIDHQLYLLLNKQFRPALNKEVYSFPAGLVDSTDSDLESAARREAKEETGYELQDIQVLLPPSPSSEGMSDECDSVVIARLSHFGKESREEFEDIQSNLYSVKQVNALLADPNVVFSLSARLLVLYLLATLAKEE